MLVKNDANGGERTSVMPVVALGLGEPCAKDLGWPFPMWSTRKSSGPSMGKWCDSDMFRAHQYNYWYGTSVPNYPG